MIKVVIIKLKNSKKEEKNIAFKSSDINKVKLVRSHKLCNGNAIKKARVKAGTKRQLYWQRKYLSFDPFHLQIFYF